MEIKKMRENNMRRVRSMKRTILAGIVVLVFVMVVVVPVVAEDQQVLVIKTTEQNW
jgi:hypothetical protein